MGTPSQNRKRRDRRRTFVALALAAVAAVVVAVAGATVWTDHADYAPGSVVTISGDNANGAGYVEGETVDVAVSGPVSGAYPSGWPAACSATVEADGSWTCTVTLDPDPAVAEGAYTYTATGATSGASETGSFTDHGPSPVTSSGFSITKNATHLVTVGVTLGGGSTTVTLTAAEAKVANQTASTTIDVTLTGPGGNGNGAWSGSFQGVCGTTYKINNVGVTWNTGHDHNATEIPGSTTSVTTDACPPADAAPSVSSTTPSNGVTGVAVGSNITVNFDESVSASTSSFTLECPTGTSKSFTLSSSPATSFTLDPTANLPYSTTCTVKVIATAISDTDSIDPPDNMVADYTFSFTTEAAPNTAPMVEAGGPYSGGEGSDIALDGASASDTDGPAPLSYLWTIESQSAGSCPLTNHTSLAGATIKCTDNGSATVKLTATEAGPGLSGSDTATVTINNVAPTADALSATSPIDEGGSSNVSLTNPTDVSSVDAASLRYSFACDGLDASLAASHPDASTTNSASCPFDDNGSYTVKGRVYDKDGGGNTYSATVVVNNVAPSITSLGVSDSSIDEGDTITLSGTFTDPGVQDTHEVVIDWGDGSTDTVNLNANVLLFSKSHAYVDDDPTGTALDTYTIEVTVTDKDGDSDTENAPTITVNNVAPTFTAANATTNPTKFGATATCAGTTLYYGFTDPGADTWTIDIDWDNDGTFEEAHANVSKNGSFPHTYATAGSHTAAIKVTDDDTGTNTVTRTVMVDYNVGGVLQPVNNTQAQNPISIFKYGSTIPVKIRVTDCDNTTAISGLSPQISVKKITGSTPVSGVDETITSTSGADSGTTMRYSDGQYIYNLATKSLADSTATYEIKITGPFATVMTQFGTRAK